MYEIFRKWHAPRYFPLILVIKNLSPRLHQRANQFLIMIMILFLQVNATDFATQWHQLLCWTLEFKVSLGREKVDPIPLVLLPPLPQLTVNREAPNKMTNETWRGSGKQRKFSQPVIQNKQIRKSYLETSRANCRLLHRKVGGFKGNNGFSNKRKRVNLKISVAD